MADPPATVRSRVTDSVNSSTIFLKFLLRNPSQSFPILTVLVPFRFLITYLVLLYLCKLLVWGFLRPESTFVHRKKN